jgi:hypothetical protein
MHLKIRRVRAMDNKLGKRILKKIGGYVQETQEEEVIGKHSFDDERFAYPRLNTIYMRILSEHKIWEKDNYLWGLLQASYLATQIHIDLISVIEFGVAGGRGLCALEEMSIVLEKEFGIGIDVYGFDTGVGLPKPVDYRDMPQLYSEGDYVMDIEKLGSRLTKAKPILGLVNETIISFRESKPAPIGFISFDLDLWSSTHDAFMLFEAKPETFMPRVYCYFDDIMGASCSEFTGERLAISEFNASHEMRKISPIYGLKYFLPEAKSKQMWAEMFYLAHIFDHQLYGEDEGWVLRRSADMT